MLMVRAYIMGMVIAIRGCAVRQSNLREPAYPFFIFLLFKIFGVSKEGTDCAGNS